MLDRRTTLVYALAGAAVTVSAWIAFVPEWLSGSTFGAMLAVTIALVVVSIVAVRSIGAPASVAQVLYEAEHPSTRVAQRGAPQGSNANEAP
jgi:hypothetical protein